MVVKVVWSEHALLQLKQIHNYYQTKASAKIAKRLTKSIVNRTILLENNPLLGTKEPLLQNRKHEYRFLVWKNYKTIYRVENKYIRIISIFDTRQNPKTLKNTRTNQ
ncbi:MAG: type II toxin-antitoxin system RelE/ParE family toxin [Prolixibacteraceae bacterium]|nr:type II toxin-antitoxin system RelE/ParE family toxin [Prolixibacteraceae bacterium]